MSNIPNGGQPGVPRNLNPNQFLKALRQPPTQVPGWNQDDHPFQEDPNTFKGPSWAMHASNALNRLEGARAFAAPGGGIRAIHHVLSGSPGQARGVRSIEVGQVLGSGGLHPGGYGADPDDKRGSEPDPD